MDTYDPMTMGYMPQPLPLNGLQNVDYMSTSSGFDMQDQYSNYDSEAFISGDDMSFAPSASLQHPALLKKYSTGYSSGFDDAYADPTLLPLDHMPPDQTVPESPSIERDNKLLSFSMPLYNFTLLDFSFRRTSLNMSAQLHGMFFLAESQWPTPPDAPPPPPELTCYRRNLFQITGSVTLPRSLRYIMTEHGDRIPILAQELAISAVESVEGNAVKIISVPWKTPAGGGTIAAEDKVEKEPPTIPLDTMAGQDLDADYASFPIQWKRLQFRIATANNGRRKELQQHFVIKMKVMATLSTGTKISIAESHSGAIIVRGRSPRNFQSRKDFPLGNSSSASRKHLSNGASRAPSGDHGVLQITSAPKVKSPMPEEVPHVLFSYENNEMAASNPDLIDWANSPLPGATSPLPGATSPLPGLIPEPIATPTYSNTAIIPPIPSYSNAPSPDLFQPLSFSYPNFANMTTPLPLCFSSDDEGSSRSSPAPRKSVPRGSTSRPKPPTSNPSPSLAQQKQRAQTLATFPPTSPLPTTTPTITPPPLQRPRFNSQQHPTTNIPSAPRSNPSPQMLSNQTSTPPTATLPFTPDEEATDTLYEYFPLGLDDWMPPVDAVYRPHVVHHTGPMPIDPKAVAAGRGRSKRYFSEDG